MSTSTTPSLNLRAVAAALLMASAALAPQAHAVVMSSTNNPLNLDGLRVFGLEAGNSWTLFSMPTPGFGMIPGGPPGFSGGPGFGAPTPMPPTQTWMGSSYLRTSAAAPLSIWTRLSANPVAQGATIDATLFDAPNTTTTGVSFTDRIRFATSTDLTYAVRFQRQKPLPSQSGFAGPTVAGQPFSYYGWVTVNLDSSRLGTPGNPMLQVTSWGFEDAGRSIAAGALSTPVTVSPVPEPSTYALALAGLGVAVWVARRRRVQA